MARCARGGAAALPHPSCKRAGEGFRSRETKSGTPPGIRTRRDVLLRHARMPFPPAGRIKQKARGPFGTPGLRESDSDRQSLGELPASGARACFSLSAISVGRFPGQINSFMPFMFLSNVALSCRLTLRKQKGPEQEGADSARSRYGKSIPCCRDATDHACATSKLLVRRMR